MLTFGAVNVIKSMNNVTMVYCRYVDGAGYFSHRDVGPDHAALGRSKDH